MHWFYRQLRSWNRPRCSLRRSSISHVCLSTRCYDDDDDRTASCLTVEFLYLSDSRAVLFVHRLSTVVARGAHRIPFQSRWLSQRNFARATSVSLLCSSGMLFKIANIAFLYQVFTDNGWSPKPLAFAPLRGVTIGDSFRTSPPSIHVSMTLKNYPDYFFCRTGVICIFLCFALGVANIFAPILRVPFSIVCLWVNQSKITTVLASPNPDRCPGAALSSSCSSKSRSCSGYAQPRPSLTTLSAASPATTCGRSSTCAWALCNGSAWSRVPQAWSLPPSSCSPPRCSTFSPLWNTRSSSAAKPWVGRA